MASKLMGPSCIIKTEPQDTEDETDIECAGTSEKFVRPFGDILIQCTPDISLDLLNHRIKLEQHPTTSSIPPLDIERKPDIRLINQIKTEDNSEVYSIISVNERQHEPRRIDGVSDSQVSVKKSHKVDTKLYQCDQCPYFSIKCYNLVRHKLSHMSVKPRTDGVHQCSECENKYAWKGTLSSHMNTHLNVKPYECDECSYTGTSSSNLSNHKRIHLKLKPYKCSECEYECTRKDSFFRHAKNQHLKLRKPYECDKCTFKSITSKCLRVHKRSHNLKLRPYQCEKCAFKSISSNGLRVHKSRQHRVGHVAGM